MPETPDFDQIARRLLVLDRENRIGDALDTFATEIAEELRQVWNARGAADIAKLEGAFEQTQPSVKVLHQALRSLDR
jgi:hypothetical protein